MDETLIRAGVTGERFDHAKQIGQWLPIQDIGIGALLGRIEADIWSGHHREVTGELEALAAERPDDGAVPRLLATSLYLSERLAEAALVCQRAIVGLQAHGLNAGSMEELQHYVLNRTLPRRDLLAA